MYQKISTLLTLTGFAMVAFSIGYSIMKLQDLRGEIAVKEGISTELQAEIVRLDAEIEHIRHGPITDLIQPRAAAVQLDGQRDQYERQLYNIILWVDLPHYRKSGIRYINYHFDHPSKLLRDREGRLASNGFAVSYLGWGCLEEVILTIVQHDRPDAEYRFPMCDNVEMQQQTGDNILRKK